MAMIISVVGGTALNPLTPADFTDGQTVNKVIVLDSGSSITIGDDSGTPTFYDDTGWVVSMSYNTRVYVKGGATWTSGYTVNGVDTGGAIWSLGFGARMYFQSSSIILNWRKPSFLWTQGEAGNNLMYISALAQSGYINANIGTIGATSTQLEFLAGTGLSYVEWNLVNCTLYFNAATRVDKTTLNGASLNDLDQTRFRANATSLTVNSYSPVSPIANIGTIYGSYTNTASKLFTFNNPDFDVDVLIMFGTNFTLAVNTDCEFTIDQPDVNIGYIAGALPPTFYAGTTFTIPNLWTGTKTIVESFSSIPDVIVDNRTTTFYISKYGFITQSYTELMPISGVYTKTLFLTPYNLITLTEAQAEVIDVELIEHNTEGAMIRDQGFDKPMIYGTDYTGTNLFAAWAAATTIELNHIYTENGVLFLRRREGVDWNSGGVVYQNYSGWVIGEVYTFTLTVLDMGGASNVRCGIDGSYPLNMTAAGTQSLNITATSTSGKVILNTHSSYYSTHTQIESLTVIDQNGASALPTDADGNSYTYEVDCKGNSVDDTFHALHHLWTSVGGATLANIPEGLSIDGSGNYNGGQGLLFTNTGGSLDSMTSDDGTVYTPPLSAVLTILLNETGCDVVVLAAGTDTVLASADAHSGTSFSYAYNSNQDVDIGVIKQGYVVSYTYGYTLSGVDATLPVTLLVDRNYQ